ncbi:MAG: hypothetical protein H0W19_03260 [Nitrosopumilus sp.]|nr:hypothetical protein [Nitrosopumilus sp.]
MSVIINVDALKIENIPTIFNNVLMLKYNTVNNIRIFHLNTARIFAIFFTAIPEFMALSKVLTAPRWIASIIIRDARGVNKNLWAGAD